MVEKQNTVVIKSRSTGEIIQLLTEFGGKGGLFKFMKITNSTLPYLSRSMARIRSFLRAFGYYIVLRRFDCPLTFDPVFPCHVHFLQLHSV